MDRPRPQPATWRVRSSAQPPKPLVLGRHLLALGMRSGPEVGRILKQIYERQLDGEITTLEEGIEAARALLVEAQKEPDETLRERRRPTPPQR